jgi:DNA-binding MurR/RpiR family transcriptional regulator
MSITEEISQRLTERGADLTPTERRIARLIAEDPELVAFGTSASVGRAAETSAPSIVRFSVKLGYTGFSDLQMHIRRDLSRQISSAYKRAREEETGHDLRAWIDVETLNVSETLSGIDPDDWQHAVALLADPSRRVFVLASEQWRGPAIMLRDFLTIIRGRIHMLYGSPFRIASELSSADVRDVLLTMDAQRNEKWVVETHRNVRAMGLRTISLTDGPLNVIAQESEYGFAVARATCGLFDSKTGLMALINFLLDSVSREMGKDVVDRLASIEKTWSGRGVFD